MCDLACINTAIDCLQHTGQDVSLELPQGALVDETIGDIEACVIVTGTMNNDVEVLFSLICGSAYKFRDRVPFLHGRFVQFIKIDAK